MEVLKYLKFACFPKTTLAQLRRAAKTNFFYSAYVLNTDLDGDVINIAANRQKFMTLTGELS